jgi:hypothetical protein
MKPQLAMFAFVGLAAAIFAVASCVTERLPVNQNAVALIGDPHATPPKYDRLKDGVQIGEPKLRRALANLINRGGVCELTFLSQAGGQPDPDYCKHVLKTDRVIKSKTASNGSRDVSAANDPNVMYKVSSPDPSSVGAVLDLLTTP